MLLGHVVINTLEEEKDDHLYCGTHIKGRPHGEINNKNDINKNVKRTVWIEEIQGINYYIDNIGMFMIIMILLIIKKILELLRNIKNWMFILYQNYLKTNIISLYLEIIFLI